MLAQHSEALILTADNIELCVPEIHKHLLEKKYKEKIQEAVHQHFAQSVKLKIALGSVTGMTPAVLQQQKIEKKQSEAIAAIETDPVVQQLVEDFDAKIIDSSINLYTLLRMAGFYSIGHFAPPFSLRFDERIIYTG